MKKSKFILLSLLFIGIIILLIILIINKTNKHLIVLEDIDYKESKIIMLDEKTYKEKEDNKENFIVYIHVPGLCTSKIPFDPLVNKFVEKNKITIYSLPYSILKETNLSKYIKYSPSLAIIKDGKLISFLDANSEKDYEYYSSEKGIENWIKSYVNLK